MLCLFFLNPYHFCHHIYAACLLLFFSITPCPSLLFSFLFSLYYTLYMCAERILLTVAWLMAALNGVLVTLSFGRVSIHCAVVLTCVRGSNTAT